MPLNKSDQKIPPVQNISAPLRRLPPIFRKLTLGALILLLLTPSLVGISLYKRISQEQMNSSYRIAEENASRLSDRIKANMDQALGIARILAVTASSTLQETSHPSPRDFLSQLLKTTITEYPAFLATWIALEPNAFAEPDALFRNLPFSDEAGRFLPYWTRAGGLHLETCTDMEAPLLGRYYQVPMQTKQTYIDSPNSYIVNNQLINLISISAPVMVNDTFKGVAGVDFSLDGVTRAMSFIKPVSEGYARLITSTGIAVVHENPNIVGMDVFKYDTSLADPALMQAIHEGLNYSRVIDKPDGRYYEIYTTIRFPDMVNSWTLLIAHPVHSPFKTNPSLFVLPIACTAMGILLIWLWAAMLIKKHLDKLTLLRQRTTALYTNPQAEPLLLPPPDELHGLSLAIAELKQDCRSNTENADATDATDDGASGGKQF